MKRNSVHWGTESVTERREIYFGSQRATYTARKYSVSKEDSGAIRENWKEVFIMGSRTGSAGFVITRTSESMGNWIPIIMNDRAWRM